MPATPTAPAARPPQARVLRNHARLLDATIEAADEDGWSGLNFANVAARAGLSRRPLQDRFADASHLAAAAWTDRAEPALQAALEELLAAGGQLGEEISVPRFTRALERLLHPDHTLRAAMELLLVAQFDLVLRAAVRRGLSAQVEEWCRPEPRQVSRATTGRRGYLLVQGIGLLIVGRRPGLEALDLRFEAKELAEALRAPVRPAALPKARARYLDETTPFDTGDPTLDALLQAVLDEVGEDGFERASVERIVAAAGCSQGALFGRYATKLDLFVDATRRQQAFALRATNDYIGRIAARFGPGIAEAVTMREMQRPGREKLRAISLEQLRISWHEPQLMAAHLSEVAAFIDDDFVASIPRTRKQAAAYAHVGLAQGVGSTALPVLFPGCWALPYDVVSVPLMG